MSAEPGRASAEPMPAAVRVGLFLGMGPLAGAEFYRHFEAAFASLPEPEHPVVFALSDPTMPRKDAGVAGVGASPLPCLHRGMAWFRRLRVEFVLAPCNTLMFYRRELEQRSGVALVDIVDAAARYVAHHHPGARRVGVLATRPTCDQGLYAAALARHLPVARTLTPDPAGQHELTRLIERIKRGEHLASPAPRRCAEATVERLAAAGAEVVIAGCTEISCLLGALEEPVAAGIPVVDSSRVLARTGAQLVAQRRGAGREAG